MSQSDSHQLAAARNQCCRSKVVLRVGSYSSSIWYDENSSSTDRRGVRRLEPARFVGFVEKHRRTRKIGLSHGNLGGTRGRFAYNWPATDRNSAAGRAAAVTIADRRGPCIELHASAPSLAGSALRGASPWRVLGDGWLPSDLALRADRHRDVCSLMCVTSQLPESRLTVTVSALRRQRMKTGLLIGTKKGLFLYSSALTDQELNLNESTP